MYFLIYLIIHVYLLITLSQSSVSLTMTTFSTLSMDSHGSHWEWNIGQVTIKSVIHLKFQFHQNPKSNYQYE